MADGSAAPDPVQRVYDAFAAAGAEDLDGTTAALAPDAVWVMDEVGLGPFEGKQAIRDFLVEWWSLWEEHNHHVEEAVVLTENVGYAIVREDGRMKGSGAVVDARVAHVIESVDGLVVRDTTYVDVEAAREAAERLARADRQPHPPLGHSPPVSEIRVSRVIAAPPATVYAALLDPAAVARWKVPDGMSSVVHELEPRVGGRVRVSLTYDGGSPGDGKTSARTDTYSGRFLELVPGELVVEALEFETDREDLRGEMTIRTELRPAGEGTEVEIAHSGLPAGVDPADNVTGTEMALAKLAALLETS